MAFVMRRAHWTPLLQKFDFNRTWCARVSDQWQDEHDPSDDEENDEGDIHQGYYAYWNATYTLGLGRLSCLVPLSVRMHPQIEWSKRGGYDAIWVTLRLRFDDALFAKCCHFYFPHVTLGWFHGSSHHLWRIYSESDALMAELWDRFDGLPFCWKTARITVGRKGTVAIKPQQELAVYIAEARNVCPSYVPDDIKADITFEQRSVHSQVHAAHWFVTSDDADKQQHVIGLMRAAANHGFLL